MTFHSCPLTLRQLQYAVAVAESLSFHKAAERCQVSQPPLSAQVAHMEKVLGLQLFERNRRRVLVTAKGHEIIERARRVLREIDDIMEFARFAADPHAGSLNIGVIPTISPYLLPRLTAPLRKAFPQIRIFWREDKTIDLLSKLEHGTLDAVLLALEADIGHIEREVVGLDPFVLATPVGHPLGVKRSPASLSELRETTVLLLDDGHCLREQALSICADVNAREHEFRGTSLSTLAQMVAGGAGITLLPELAITTEARHAKIALRRFMQPVPKRTIVLGWRPHSPLDSLLRQVAIKIKDVYSIRDRAPSGLR